VHHSPSSVKTAQTCMRKWWYEYRERRREPEVPWSAIAAAGPAWATVCTSSQRAKARGTETHARLEAYYEGRPVVWTDEPGELALRMRTHLPTREACLEVRVEQSVGAEPYPSEDEPDRTALLHEGVRWLGYVDLEVRLAPRGPEVVRLGLDANVVARSNGWVTFDYKTSADVSRYAVTADEVLTGEDGGQGVLYSLDGMQRTRTDVRVMRWVYAQTKGTRIAKPVDVAFTEERARRVLTVLSEGARNRELITSVDQCDANTDACTAYGGCPHHHSRGGPCTPGATSIRSMIMGWADKYKADQAAQGSAPTAGPQGSAPTAQVTMPVDAAPIPPPAGAVAHEAGTVFAANPPPAPPTEAPKPAKRGTGMAKAVTPPPAVGTFAELAAALAASEADVIAATAELDAAKAAMRAALG
jgi:hypothetical protein